jgi:1-acyl-sn-glycerol-3-phosphate acyltransferase
VFPVVRGADGGDAVATAAAHAAAGRPVLVFPAGARRRTIQGEERPKTGAARAAIAAGVPLIPAAVAGTDGAARWRVRYGPSVTIADLVELPHRDAVRAATERLWVAIAALERELELERTLPLAVEGSAP